MERAATCPTALKALRDAVCHVCPPACLPAHLAHLSLNPHPHVCPWPLLQRAKADAMGPRHKTEQLPQVKPPQQVAAVVVTD